MQDFVPPEKRSIRNISIDRPQTTSPEMGESEQPSENLGAMLPPRFFKEKKTGWRRYALRGGIVVVAVLIILFVISSLFSSATVAVTPKHTLASLDHTFSAFASPATGAVGFQTVTLDKEASMEVAATGQETVSKPASGTIIVYNNYDTNTQKLITNTRFETKDGLVYRIHAPVVIPGQHKDPATGELTPGSLEVVVYADQPGEKYNVGLTDFTIPGFKEQNDPRYAKFYARSKTAMSGGFSGVVRTASAADTQTAVDTLKAQLTTELSQGITAALPEGFLPVPSSAALSFETLPNGNGKSDSTVSIQVKGTVSEVAIDETSLGAQVAQVFVPDYDGSDVYFQDPSAISITPTASSTLAAGAGQIEFKITGVTNLLWKYDEKKLAQDLAGVSRNAVSTVFAKYPGIEKADVSVSPFWKTSLPGNPDKITVVTQTNS
jgi:hypothetical protein